MLNELKKLFMTIVAYSIKIERNYNKGLLIMFLNTCLLITINIAYFQLKLFWKIETFIITFFRLKTY